MRKAQDEPAPAYTTVDVPERVATTTMPLPERTPPTTVTPREAQAAPTRSAKAADAEPRDIVPLKPGTKVRLPGPGHKEKPRGTGRE